MTGTRAPRPLAAVSLKAYLGQGQTLAWLDGVARAAVGHPEVEVAVLPLATALADAARVVATVPGMTLGAQKVSRFPAGPYTGEVPAAVLAELGVRYVEIAHAERRRHLGEGDEEFAAEALAAGEHGLVPLVCVGEPDRGSPQQAVAECVAHLERILPGNTSAPAVIAYEPEWAIGAAEPAPAEHVLSVLGGLRSWASETHRSVQLLYGGTAGPGTFSDLFPIADGLFLGRRAHDPTALAAVLAEMSTRSSTEGDAP